MSGISYHLIRSDRKTLSLQIDPEGNVIVRAPNRMPKREIDAFLLSKQDWIEKHLNKARPASSQPRMTQTQLRSLAQEALNWFPARTALYAGKMGVSYGRITIRAQHTRWGSCSSRGNLNFNCLLMLLPDDVIDSVVVHELCHRKHMDHSARFYAEVEKVFPEYKRCDQWLKENGSLYLSRLS